MSDLPTIQLECKKDGLQQLQNGTWKLTMTVNGEDMGNALPLLGPAPMGTRYQVVMVEIGDDEAPVNRSEPKPGDPVKSVAGYAKPPMKESQRCGMLCADSAFQHWLAAHDPTSWEFCGGHGPAVNWPVVAADVVRGRLGIVSRRELNDASHPALTEWHRMLAQFEADTGRIAVRTR